MPILSIPLFWFIQIYYLLTCSSTKILGYLLWHSNIP